MNEVNAINPDVAIVENVAEMESVNVMASADAATSGQPLIEVIDEGQVVLSSGFPSTWLHLVSSCSIVPCPFSDHEAVLLRFSIPESFPRGPGRWKLNVSILRNPVFFQTVSDFWPRLRSRAPSFSSLQHWWDRGKEHLKSLAVVLIMNILCRALSFLPLLVI